MKAGLSNGDGHIADYTTPEHSYDIEWIPAHVQPTRVGVGRELMYILGLMDAAKKAIAPSPFRTA